MKSAPLLLLALFLFACSSAPTRPVFSDYMEVRELKADDPLAGKFANIEGEEFRLGDPIVTGKAIARLQVKRAGDEKFDLYVTLTGAEDSRWRRFARSKGRQAALVIDGIVCCVFDVQDPGPPKENEVLVFQIPNVAQSQEEADKLDRYLEDGRVAKKKKAVE